MEERTPPGVDPAIAAYYDHWNQGRQGNATPAGQLRGSDTGDVAGDLRELFGLRPSNTFLVKASYYFTR